MLLGFFCFLIFVCLVSFFVWFFVVVVVIVVVVVVVVFFFVFFFFCIFKLECNSLLSKNYKQVSVMLSFFFFLSFFLVLSTKKCFSHADAYFCFHPFF